MRNRILQRLENKRRNRFQMGGMPLPGGKMEQIPGTDAVEFNGQTHNQGGIMMDNVTEVEDGETMDQVTMRGGGPKDYFFSSYLQTGGKSFADNHKEILEDGGSQSDIDYLAQMQEQAAGRDPNQVAKLGGIVKYHEGGAAEQDHIDMMNQGTLDAHNAEGNTGNTEGSMYGPNSENPGGPEMEWGAGWNMGGGGTGFGIKTPYGSFGMRPKAPKNWGEAGMLLAGPAANLTGLAGKGIAAGQKLWDKVFQEGGMYNQRKQYQTGGPTADEIMEGSINTSGDKIFKNGEWVPYTKKNSQEGRKFQVPSDEVYGGIDDEMGIVPDHQPGYMVDGVQMYTGEEDTEFRDKLNDPNFRENWMNNVDPEVLKSANITDFSDMGDPDNVTAYQNAWNAKYPENPVIVDGKFGEQTFRTARVPASEKEEDTSEDPKTIPEVPETKKKDYTGTLLGLGSMIPAVMAFRDKPDYMKDPDLMAPGIVKSERVAKQHLDRIDFNDQIARNAADAGAMNKFIETSGGGPASMSNKMALYAKKQTGDREIKAQEARANIAIANEEAGMDLKRKERNATAALDASKFNVTAQQDASKSNIRNEMYIDEFNRSADAATKDRKLNAVQYGINTLANLHRDKLMYQASDNLTDAIDGTRGVMDRFNNRTNNIIPYNETKKSKRGGYRRIKNLRR